MRCQWVRQQLAVYRDLTDSEREALDEHVAQCPVCLALWERFQAQDRALAALPQRDPRPQWVAGVLARTSRRGGRSVAVGRPLVRALAMSLVALSVLMAGTLGASAQALPGGPLYGVKRTVEQVRLTLTLDETQRGAYQEQLVETRREEVRQVVAQGKSVAVAFQGTLEGVGESSLVVNGIEVAVAPETARAGAALVGQVVAVQGQVSQGRVAATAVLVRPTAAPSEPPVLGTTRSPDPTPRPRATELKPEPSPTATAAWAAITVTPAVAIVAPTTVAATPTILPERETLAWAAAATRTRLFEERETRRAETATAWPDLRATLRATLAPTPLPTPTELPPTRTPRAERPTRTHTPQPPTRTASATPASGLPTRVATFMATRWPSLAPTHETPVLITRMATFVATRAPTVAPPTRLPAITPPTRTPVPIATPWPTPQPKPTRTPAGSVDSAPSTPVPTQGTPSTTKPTDGTAPTPQGTKAPAASTNAG
ncbi:MAG: DUF5667 domain-containing protein [Chloroflexota bacterium]